MPDTYVDTEVEVEVDSMELEVEAGEHEEFETELSAPGLEIEVEAEIEVTSDHRESGDSGEDDEYLAPEAEGMALDESDGEEQSDLE